MPYLTKRWPGTCGTTKSLLLALDAGTQVEQLERHEKLLCDLLCDLRKSCQFNDCVSILCVEAIKITSSSDIVAFSPHGRIDISQYMVVVLAFGISLRDKSYWGTKGFVIVAEVISKNSKHVKVVGFPSKSRKVDLNSRLSNPQANYKAMNNKASASPQPQRFVGMT